MAGFVYSLTKILLITIVIVNRASGNGGKPVPATPKLVIQGKAKATKDSGAVRLTCEDSNGTPTGSYEWFDKDGNAIAGESGKTMDVTPDKVEERKYKCKVKFTGETQKRESEEFTLTITEPKLIIKGKEKATKDSGTVTLSCDEENGASPTGTYEWFDKDGNAIAGESGKTLDVTPDKVEERKYKCKAKFTGAAQKTESEEFTFTITEPKILTVTGHESAKLNGDDVTLTCTETTTPSGATPDGGATAYVWYKGAAPQSTKTKTYTVTPDTKGKSVYKCEATFDSKLIKSEEFTFTVSDYVYKCKKFKKEGTSWQEDGNSVVICGINNENDKDKCRGPGSDFDANGKFNEATTICTECKDTNNKQCTNKKLITYECPKYTWNKETTSFKKENDAKDTCYTTDEKKKDTCSKPGKKAEEGNIHAKAPGVCIPCTDDEKKDQKCGAMGLSAFIAPLVIVLYMMVM